MAKKRVHEIAKDLKAHGIDLSHKDLVTDLVALGYDVKSHSSSIEEDQAEAALAKILEKHKPAAPPAPKHVGGVMVRRRKADIPAAPAPTPEAAPSPEPAVVEAAPTAPTATPEVAPAVAPPPPVETPAPVEPLPVAPAVTAPAVATSPATPPTTVTEPPAPLAPVAPPPRPTANQAVVISRPTSPVRRVTPPSSSSQIPLAPGPKAIGDIKEVRVVQDFMRPGGRDFIDVSKDKAAKRKGPRLEKENFSKQELIELVRAGGLRAAMPIRGKKKKPVRKGQKTPIAAMAEDKKVIRIDAAISVADLSQTMGIKASELIKKMMTAGNMVTVNHLLNPDEAELLASEYGWKVERVGFTEESILKPVEDKPEELRPRPPVVTVMGHVDHGKTSLLDAIRHANVAEGEAGGITQHIGAYSVNTPKGPITFIDTPGHEAFTAMRARGAKVTDLVVLVVAADDGVMPQTIEAINHAKAAKVPILVAINKMDKPGANPQHVKNQLMEQQLVDEQLGGDVIMLPVSARTKEGIDHLLEMISLQAEVLELKANPGKPASGTIIEAKLDKGRGPIATVIVQEGTLKVGDSLVTGVVYGRVRAMVNDRGDQVEEVPPGYPVEVLGLSGVPIAGDDFTVVEDEKAAKEVAGHRSLEARKKDLAPAPKATLENLFQKVELGEAKELRIILKADVQGSEEAVSEALKALTTKKVSVNLIHGAVGNITESDVQLAASSEAIVVGFNAKPDTKSQQLANQLGVQIKQYAIIYEAVDDVRLAMQGLLKPILKEKVIGRAEVRNLFNIPKIGQVAGCAVVDGVINRSALVRVIRDKVPVYTGKVGSLRRFKDDVREVQSGFECGLSLENYGDIKQGDVLEAYEIEEIRQSLS
jgi:translation initiation factor IF-2